MTPLHVAICNCCLSVVEYLIQHGANINIKTFDGRSPLSIAIEYSKSEIVNVLRMNGEYEG